METLFVLSTKEHSNGEGLHNSRAILCCLHFCHLRLVLHLLVSIQTPWWHAAAMMRRVNGVQVPLGQRPLTTDGYNMTLHPWHHGLLTGPVKSHTVFWSFLGSPILYSWFAEAKRCSCGSQEMTWWWVQHKEGACLLSQSQAGSGSSSITVIVSFFIFENVQKIKGKLQYNIFDPSTLFPF